MGQAQYYQDHDELIPNNQQIWQYKAWLAERRIKIPAEAYLAPSPKWWPDELFTYDLDEHEMKMFFPPALVSKCTKLGMGTGASLFYVRTAKEIKAQRSDTPRRTLAIQYVEMADRLGIP